MLALFVRDVNACLMCLQYLQFVHNMCASLYLPRAATAHFSHTISPILFTLTITKKPFFTPTGNYREALPIYSEALRIYREVYGAEHPSIAEILLVVAGFQNTFMNDMQQYIEHINTR